MNKNVFSLSGGSLQWIRQGIVSSFEDADVVVLEGGADWNPDLYKQQPNTHTTFWHDTRDTKEMELISRATKAGKIVFGICRGIQGLTIYNGGSLIQHINHPSRHNVIDERGETYEFNSCHHQMCNPFDLPKEDYRILAWTNNISPIHLVENNVDLKIDVEPEVLYFPKTRHLGAQGHPEWMSSDSEAVIKMNNYIDELLSTNIIK
jgi:hypothetical protein